MRQVLFFLWRWPQTETATDSPQATLQSWRVVSALWWLTRVGSMQVNAVNSLCPVVIARAVWSWSILKVRDGLCPGLAHLYFEEVPYMTFPVGWDESLEVLELHMMPEEPLNGPSARAPAVSCSWMPDGGLHEHRPPGPREGETGGGRFEFSHQEWKRWAGGLGEGSGATDQMNWLWEKLFHVDEMKLLIH